MRNIVTICSRELRSFFVSPIAYVITSLFLFICSYVFLVTAQYMQLYETASFEIFFSFVYLTLFLMCPVLTMRLLAEERKSGTIELLMTAPVTETQVVLGKFFAVVVFYLTLLGTTAMYPIILFYYGNPDPGPIISGYIGLFLLGCTFLSVGVFTSSFSRNQIISAIASLFFLLVLMLLAAAEVFFQSRGAKEVINYLTITVHYEQFIEGLVDTKSIIYFCIVTVFFLLLSIITLKSTKSR